MKLHVDLGTGYLIEGPGFRNPVTSLRFKRGDAATLEVVFLADGTTVAELANPANLEMHFGVKARNGYDEQYLVHTSAWTLPSYGAVNPVYRCSPSFNTEELNDALGVGSATGTEFPELVLMGEITWRVGAADPTSTRTFVVVVENDVNRGTEGVPTSAEPPYPAPENIEFVSRKGAANGYAGLGADGKVPWTQLKVVQASMDSTGASVGQVLTAIANNQAGWETPETKGAARHAGRITHSATVELVGGNGGDFATASLGTPPGGLHHLVVMCTSHVSGGTSARKLLLAPFARAEAKGRFRDRSEGVCLLGNCFWRPSQGRRPRGGSGIGVRGSVDVLRISVSYLSVTQIHDHAIEEVLGSCHHALARTSCRAASPARVI